MYNKVNKINYNIIQRIKINNKVQQQKKQKKIFLKTKNKIMKSISIPYKINKKENKSLKNKFNSKNKNKIL